MSVRRLLIVAAILLLAVAVFYRSWAGGARASGKLFPYAYSIDDLPDFIFTSILIIRARPSTIDNPMRSWR